MLMRALSSEFARLGPNTSSHVSHHCTLDLLDWREGTRVSPSRLPVFLQPCPGSPEPLLAVIASGLGTPHGSRKQQSHFTSWYTVAHCGVDDACFTSRRVRIFHIISFCFSFSFLAPVGFSLSTFRFCKFVDALRVQLHENHKTRRRSAKFTRWRRHAGSLELNKNEKKMKSFSKKHSNSHKLTKSRVTNSAKRHIRTLRPFNCDMSPLHKYAMLCARPRSRFPRETPAMPHF